MSSNKKKFLSFWNSKEKLFLFFKIILVGVCILLGIITRPSQPVLVTMSPKIAILYICTGRYIIFWDDFYKTMEKNFLPGYEKTYFVFTDDTTKKFPSNVVKIYQKQLPWPLITLLRYHFFQEIIPQLQQYDYIYFLNANMMPIRKIGTEIFPSTEQGLAVTKHPGYYRIKNPDLLTYDRNKKSHAYIPYGEGSYYFMGGFNGGRTPDFIQLIDTIVRWTEVDLKKGIIPLWHDESYLNRYMINYMKTKNPLILSEKYGSVKEYGMHDAIMWILPKHKYNVYR